MNPLELSIAMLNALLPELVLTGGLLAIITIEVVLLRLRRSWGQGLAVGALVIYAVAIVALIHGATVGGAGILVSPSAVWQVS